MILCYVVLYYVMYVFMYICIYCMCACFMHAWMDGWMDGWMDVWMDGWMDVCMYVCMYVWVTDSLSIYSLLSRLLGLSSGAHVAGLLLTRRAKLRSTGSRLESLGVLKCDQVWDRGLKKLSKDAKRVNITG